MRTQRILWRAGAAAVGAMLLVAVAAVFVTARDRSRAEASERVSAAVREASLLRGLLSRSSPLQRAAAPWRHHSEALRQLLQAVPPRGEQSDALRRRLLHEREAIDALHAQLSADAQADGAPLLHGQLEVRTSVLLNDLLTLHRLLEEEAGAASAWGLGLMLGAPLLLAAILLRLLLTLERRIAVPLAVLAQAADRVGAGALDVPIRADANFEVRQLALSLDRMRQALQERDRARNQFIFMLAHELRHPLQPILHSLALLERVDADSPIGRRATEAMRRQGAQLSRLIEDLLDATRALSGKLHVRPRAMDLCDVVRDAVEDQRADADARGVELAAHLPDDAVSMQGDPQRLAQLLANLLRNALQATPHGGHVTVSLRHDAAAPTWCELRVADDGAGIASDLQAHLFEPFVQGRTSAGGLGLGLSVVRSIAQSHGGTVQAHSRGVPGEGAAFVVRLPCEPAPRPVAAASAAAGEEC